MGFDDFDEENNPNATKTIRQAIHSPLPQFDLHKQPKSTTIDVSNTPQLEGLSTRAILAKKSIKSNIINNVIHITTNILFLKEILTHFDFPT